MRVKISAFLFLLLFSFGVTYENGSVKSEYLQFIWNAPSLIIVVFPSLVIAWGATSFHGSAVAWRILLFKRLDFNQEELEEAHKYVASFAKVAIYSSILGALIGAVLMLQSTDDLSTIGPKLSIMLICPLYASLILPLAHLVSFRIESDLQFSPDKKPQRQLSKGAKIGMGAFATYLFLIMILATFEFSSSENATGKQYSPPIDIEVPSSDLKHIVHAKIVLQSMDENTLLFLNSRQYYLRDYLIRSLNQMNKEDMLDTGKRQEFTQKLNEGIQRFLSEEFLDESENRELASDVEVLLQSVSFEPLAVEATGAIAASSQIDKVNLCNRPINPIYFKSLGFAKVNLMG